MKKQLSTLLLLLTAQLAAVNTNAQWSNVTTNNFNNSCNQKTDVIIDGVNNPKFYRFGILNRGTWGGSDLGDQYINIGPGDLAATIASSINAPVNNTLYGLTTSMNSDRLFVGLRARTAITNCTNNYTLDNNEDALIAWGNDDGTEGQTADRLIFEFHKYAVGAPPLEVATMLYNGNVGIGTPAPTHQLHVKQGVRFEGLPTVVFNPAMHTVLVQDHSGVLYQTNLTGGGGLVNNCTTTNFVPKTDSTGNLTCSQIYDDGTSVGIATTTGTVGSSFTYSMGAGYGTLLGTISSTPASGTIKLDVNGVSRSLAFLAYSDESLKTNIRKVDHALDIINGINAKTYDWNQKAKETFNADNGRHIGFIAQELAKIVPEVVTKDSKNNYAVNYTELIPILAEGIKEQQIMIDELKKEVATLQNPANVDDVNSSTIFKVYPNPANTSVTIELTSIKNNDGTVLITDLNGKMVKKISISEFNSNSYKIEKGALTPGIYLVNLISNNTATPAQKLVITE